MSILLERDSVKTPSEYRLARFAILSSISILLIALQFLNPPVQRINLSFQICNLILRRQMFRTIFLQ